MQRRALITGCTGMDGSHLADLLLEKGYEVHGIARRCSRPILQRLEHLDGSSPEKLLFLHDADLLDQGSLDRVVTLVQPHEVYHLGAQSFVGSSWQQPILTAEVTGLGTLRVLEALRHHAPDARFYQASSSEMFGNAGGVHQDESTPFHPRSPYGVAKAFGHQIATNYRESYGMHVSCGILFNHESERRGLEFVTRKISRGVAQIAAGQKQELLLGNLEASRDWGYAPDYVRAMWMMLQQETPGDYVIATGQTHSVADFVQAAFVAAGIPDWKELVGIDPQFMRPAELHVLRGDSTKARQYLEWVPTVGFEELVGRMVRHDLEEVGARGVCDRSLL